MLLVLNDPSVMADLIGASHRGITNRRHPTTARLYFDMNRVHADNFNLLLARYRLCCLIGHYDPTCNHFIAFSIKDLIGDWLEPKPLPCRKPREALVGFEDYLPSAGKGSRP